MSEQCRSCGRMGGHYPACVAAPAAPAAEAMPEPLSEERLREFEEEWRDTPPGLTGLRSVGDDFLAFVAEIRRLRDRSATLEAQWSAASGAVESVIDQQYKLIGMLNLLTQRRVPLEHRGDWNADIESSGNSGQLEPETEGEQWKSKSR